MKESRSPSRAGREEEPRGEEERSRGKSKHRDKDKERDRERRSEKDRHERKRDRESRGDEGDRKKRSHRSRSRSRKEEHGAKEKEAAPVHADKERIEPKEEPLSPRHEKVGEPAAAAAVKEEPAPAAAAPRVEVCMEPRMGMHGHGSEYRPPPAGPCMHAHTVFQAICPFHDGMGAMHACLIRARPRRMARGADPMPTTQAHVPCAWRLGQSHTCAHVETHGYLQAWTILCAYAPFSQRICLSHCSRCPLRSC